MGAFVGTFVGALVGAFVGTFVGWLVGAGVGAGVEHLQFASVLVQAVNRELWHSPDKQSVPLVHVCHAAHPGHGPPQSTPVSLPSCTPFMQVEKVGGGVGKVVGEGVGYEVGAGVGNLVGALVGAAVLQVHLPMSASV